MNKKTCYIVGGLALAYVLTKSSKALAGLGDDFDNIDIGPAPVVGVNAAAYWANQAQNYNNLAYGYGSVSNPNPYGYYGPYMGSGATYPYGTSYPYAGGYGYNPTYQGITGGVSAPGVSPTYSSDQYGQCSYDSTLYSTMGIRTCGLPPGGAQPYGYTLPPTYAAPYQQPYQTPYVSPYQVPYQYPQTQYPAAYSTAGTCQLIAPVGNRCYPGYVKYRGFCRPTQCPVSMFR